MMRRVKNMKKSDWRSGFLRNIQSSFRKSGVPAMMLMLLVASMVHTAFAAPGATVFVDVPADHDFAEAIGYLKKNGIVQGYPDQTFKPDAPISRAEFLKIAMKMSGRGGEMTSGSSKNDTKAPTSTSTKAPANSSVGSSAGSSVKAPTVVPKIFLPKGVFTDVHEDDWFFRDIVTAQKLGVISSSAQFAPNAVITRVQALKIAMNAFQFSPPVIKSGKSGAGSSNGGVGVLGDPLPSDLSPKAWYYTQVMSARRLNILTDSDDGKFYPDISVTRGMAAEILFRVKMSKEQQYAPIDITRGWKTVEWKVGGGAKTGVKEDGQPISFKIPKSWTAVQDGSRIIVLKRDTSLPLDYELVTPLSARLVINTHVLEVDESAESYFARLKELNRQAFSGEKVEFTSVELMGGQGLHVKVLARGSESWYVYLPNKTVVTIHGRYGIGSLSLKLRESLRGIVRSLLLPTDLPHDAVELNADAKKLLAEVRGQILVEKVGKTVIASIGDAVIFETDDIGVGTGPVDYYYSAKLNLALKYERSSDIILSVRDGKTSAF